MPTASEYLVLAARKGMASKIAALIARGADVDFADDHNMTPLFHALVARDMDVLEALCMAGADPDLPWTPPHTHTRSDGSHNNHDHKPDHQQDQDQDQNNNNVNEQTSTSSSTPTSTQPSAPTSTQPSTPPHYGCSPLCAALLFQCGQAVEILLSYGADPDAPLHVPGLYPPPPMSSYASSSSQPHSSSQPPSSWPCPLGKVGSAVPPAVADLLGLSSVRMFHPCLLATLLGDDEGLEMLLLAGADLALAAQPVQDVPLLHIAVALPFSAGVDLLLDPELDLGIDPSAPCPSTGATPLHFAGAYSGDLEICKALKDAGADFQALDGEGRTPLAFAQDLLPPPEVLRFLTNYTKIPHQSTGVAAILATVHESQPQSPEVLHFPEQGATQPVLLLGSILSDIDELAALPALAAVPLGDDHLGYDRVSRDELRKMLISSHALSSVAIERFLCEVDVYNNQGSGVGASGAAGGRGVRSGSIAAKMKPMATNLGLEEGATITMAVVSTGTKFRRHAAFAVTLRPPGVSVQRKFKDFTWMVTLLRNTYPYRAVPSLPVSAKASDAESAENVRRGLVSFLRILYSRPEVFDRSLIKAFLLQTDPEAWESEKKRVLKHPPPSESDSHRHARDAASLNRPDADTYLGTVQTYVTSFVDAFQPVLEAAKELVSVHRAEERAADALAKAVRVLRSSCGDEGAEVVDPELERHLQTLMSGASAVMDAVLARDVDAIAGAVNVLATSAKRALEIGKAMDAESRGPDGLRTALKSVSLKLVSVLNTVPVVTADPDSEDALMAMNDATHGLCLSVERLLSLLALVSPDLEHTPQRSMAALGTYAETRRALGAMHTRQAAVEEAILLDTMGTTLNVASALLVAFENRAGLVAKFESSQKKTLGAQVKLNTARAGGAGPGSLAKLEDLARHNQSKLEQRRVELAFATYALLQEVEWWRSGVLAGLVGGLARAGESGVGFWAQVVEVWEGMGERLGGLQ